MARKPGSLNKSTLLRQALETEGLDKAAIEQLLELAKTDPSVYTNRGIAVKSSTSRAPKQPTYTPPSESPVGEPVAPQ